MINQPAFPQPQSSSNNSFADKKKPYIIVALVLLLVGSVAAYLLLNKSSEAPISTTITQETRDFIDPQEISEGQDSTRLQQLEDEQELEQDLPPLDEEMSQPVAKDTTLSLLSNQASYQVGQQLEALIQLEGSVMFDGVQAIISYNPEILQNVQVIQVSEFGSLISNKIESETGRIKFVLVRNPQEEVDLSQANSLIKISGDISQTGALTLSFDRDNTMVSGAAGKEILEVVNDLTVSVQ